MPKAKKIPLSIARGILCYLFIVVVFGHIELLPRDCTHQTALTPDAALGLAANLLVIIDGSRRSVRRLLSMRNHASCQDKGILPAAPGLAISRQGPDVTR